MMIVAFLRVVTIHRRATLREKCANWISRVTKNTLEVLRALAVAVAPCKPNLRKEAQIDGLYRFCTVEPSWITFSILHSCTINTLHSIYLRGKTDSVPGHFVFRHLQALKTSVSFQFVPIPGVSNFAHGLKLRLPALRQALQRPGVSYSAQAQCSTVSQTGCPTGDR
jgi:hypothetical protein